MSRHFNTAEVVITLYRFLLRREPDDAGLLEHCATLENGGSLEALMAAMASSEEFKTGLYDFVRKLD